MPAPDLIDYLDRIVRGRLDGVAEDAIERLKDAARADFRNAVHRETRAYFDYLTSHPAARKPEL
jgi:hypothetical protein